MIAKAIGATSTASSTLDYLHHDKGAITADRVTWSENVNCIQASAEGTDHMWAQLVDDAPEIKRLAGGSTRGRRLDKPYAHYVTSWSPDENPSRDEMMTATKGAMDRLGYKGCQYRVVAHSDTDHKHTHAIVCRVHPETGRAMGRKNDGYRLREWALEYEKTQGRIRVPGRLDAHTQRARYMRLKREQPDKKPPRATDAEKTRRRERRHRGVRTRDALGRPIDLTASERQEWAVLFQSRPTPSEKADLKKSITERRIIKAGSERTVAATPPPMTMRPSPTLHRDDARVGLDVRPTPPPMTMRPSPTLHRDDARVGLDVRPTPPPMTMRPSPTLHRDDARVGLDVRPTPPPMTMRPPPKERPAVAQVPRPDHDQVQRPDHDLAASPTPAPQAADRETEWMAAAEAAERTDRVEKRAAAEAAEAADREAAHAARAAFERAAMNARDYETRDVAADIVASQPARVPWDPVEAELDRRYATDDHRYTERLDIGHGVKLDLGGPRMDLELQILEHAKSGRSRVPPARQATLGATITAVVESIQKGADQLVNRILDKVLGRVRDPAPTAATLPAAAPTAAPADEPPAPPASPQPDPSLDIRDEPAAQSTVYGAELHPDRGAGELAGGRTAADEGRTGGGRGKGIDGKSGQKRS